MIERSQILRDTARLSVDIQALKLRVEGSSRSLRIVADILRAFEATDGDEDDDGLGPITTVKPIV